MTNRTARTPQDASLRALAACAAAWGGDTSGLLLEPALFVAILTAHHGVDPQTAIRLADYGLSDDDSDELARAYDDARAERKLLMSAAKSENALAGAA